MKTNNEFQSKIAEALEQFKQGYKKRDISIIDTYIENLFEKHDKTAMLGTSFGEWVRGPEGAKEIVQSDWEYWGDVDVDTSNARISIFDDVAFVSLTGTVRYVFEYTEEKYESYLNFVKRFFDPANDQYKMSAKAKAGNIGFVLTHFNQNREAGKREYFYPLRIDAVMTLQEDRAVFRFMKFSMDYYGRYPELRIDNQMMNMAEFYEQQKGFAEACTQEQRPEAKDIIAQFKALVETGFNGTAKAEEINEFFVKKNSPCMIDPAGKRHSEDTAAFIEKQRAVWSSLAIDYNAVFTDAEGDTAWLVSNALASSTIEQEKGAEMLMKDIQNTVESGLSAKEKLFVVQRETASYFFQQARGESYLWPLRIAAMLVKEEGQWKIFNMSFSYPFYYVLEGKYTTANML